MEVPYPAITFSGNNYQGIQLGSNFGSIFVNQLGKAAGAVLLTVDIVVVNDDFTILTGVRNVVRPETPPEPNSTTL